MGKDITLYYIQDGKLISEQFELIKAIEDRGSSTVCYTAKMKYQNQPEGILKEFRPEYIESCFNAFDPGEDVLFQNQSDEEEFRSEELKYRESYEKIQSILAENPNSVIREMIPNIRIYFGGEKHTGTTYIYMDMPKLQPFSSYIQSVHRHENSRNAETNLRDILSMIESIAVFADAFHKKNLLFLDIKPQNFVRNTMKCLVPIDFDSVISVDEDVPKRIRITEAYADDSSFVSKLIRDSNEYPKLDICSIGCTLYYALFFKEYEEKNNLDPDFTEEIQNSVLILESERANAGAFRKILNRILKKCLRFPTDRYRNCGELLLDLRQVQSLLDPKRPSEMSPEEAEKYIILNIYDLLNQHPVYEKGSETDVLNVAVIGLGEYGAHFLDICLTNCQMLRQKLHVTVLTANQKDANIYLEKRPALHEFFRIDGKVPAAFQDPSEDYGEIDILYETVCPENAKDVFKRLQKKYGEAWKPHYIFAAVDDSSSNDGIIKALTGKRRSAGIFKNCIAAFAWNEDNAPENLKDCQIAVDFRKRPVRKANIERMAFNIHALWSNQPFLETEKSFKDPYNYHSSVSSAMSIQYLMHSIGIKMDAISSAEDYGRIAAAYQERLSNDTKLQNELACREHKRWVSYMLTDGWKPQKNLDACFSDPEHRTKNKSDRTHICLVPGTPERLKANRRFVNYKEDEIAAMDPLNQVSVRLHNGFHTLRERVPERIDFGMINELYRIATDDPLMMSAVYALQHSIQALLPEDVPAGAVKVYLERHGALQRLIEHKFSGQLKLKEEALSYVKRLDVSVKPCVLAAKQTDYKQYDVDMIMKYPYILTADIRNIYVAVPIDASEPDNAEKVFRNVASVLLLNPGRIFFYAFAYTLRDVKNLKCVFEKCSNIIEKRGLRSEYRLTIFCMDNVYRACKDAVELKIDICLLHSDRDDIGNYLISLERRTRINGMRLMVDLLSTAVHVPAQICKYYFDMQTMRFTDISGCQALTYFFKKDHIDIEDIALLVGAKSIPSDAPGLDYNAFMKLWSKYCTNSSIWKRFTGQYKEDYDEIKLNPSQNVPEPFSYTYFLPAFCEPAVGKILHGLKKYKVIEAGSNVVFSAIKFITVCIRTRVPEENVRKIFQNPYLLANQDEYEIYKNSKGECCVKHRPLELHITEKKASESEVKNMLIYLNKLNFITGYSETDFSCTCATKDVRDLLTYEGRILELYAYFKLRESGIFDHVVTSYEIRWNGMDNPDSQIDEQKNEMDLIAVKDYCVYLFECKAVTELTEEMVLKFQSVTGKFRINPVKILICDNPDISKETTKRALKICNQYQIRVILKARDIIKEVEKIIEETENR